MSKSKRSIVEKYNSPFAKSIRELMSEQGTTQDVLAEKIGKTRQTVSQYVNGISEPGYDTLVKIADHFGVSTDYLLGRSVPKTVDTTAQAVIAYTGLSEDNVLTLHHMKENASNPMLSDAADDGTININGCKPYLDCLNDLLDAIYSKKDTIIRDYIPMQYYAEWNKHYDPLHFSEERELDLQAHGHTSVPISAFIEQKSIKIAREIEKYLIGKYTGMDGDDE
jgi:transcriptional regulator with XRE-family HTH domain